MIIAISNQTNVRVFLKSIAYPYKNLILDFEKNKLTLLYDVYRYIVSRILLQKNSPIIVIKTSK